MIVGKPTAVYAITLAQKKASVSVSIFVTTAAACTALTKHSVSGQTVCNPLVLLHLCGLYRGHALFPDLGCLGKWFLSKTLL